MGSNFGAIYVGIMHAKFQLSSFNGVGGGGGGDRRKDVEHSWTDPYSKFLNFPFALLRRDKHEIIYQQFLCQWRPSFYFTYIIQGT